MREYSVRFINRKRVVIMDESQLSEVLGSELHTYLLELPGFIRLDFKSEEFGKVMVTRIL